MLLMQLLVSRREAELILSQQKCVYLFSEINRAVASKRHLEPKKPHFKVKDMYLFHTHFLQQFDAAVAFYSVVSRSHQRSDITLWTAGRVAFQHSCEQVAQRNAGPVSTFFQISVSLLHYGIVYPRMRVPPPSA